ncbi:ANPRA [Mytilus coruscus]|uniref:guanylate cyclase n=1 Tax=Mytilus coruscus TaxID=42192 RepID=A0A6J8BF87_MYTCO|nr:ANPRA [Mytilus coruscus]
MRTGNMAKQLRTTDTMAKQEGRITCLNKKDGYMAKQEDGKHGQTIKKDGLLSLIYLGLFNDHSLTHEACCRDYYNDRSLTHEACCRDYYNDHSLTHEACCRDYYNDRPLTHEACCRDYYNDRPLTHEACYYYNDRSLTHEAWCRDYYNDCSLTHEACCRDYYNDRSLTHEACCRDYYNDRSLTHEACCRDYINDRSLTHEACCRDYYNDRSLTHEECCRDYYNDHSLTHEACCRDYYNDHSLTHMKHVVETITIITHLLMKHVVETITMIAHLLMKHVVETITMIAHLLMKHVVETITMITHLLMKHSICGKYDIVELEQYLEKPLTKIEWKKFTTKKIHKYWEGAIKTKMKRYSTLRYLKCEYDIGRIHPLLKTTSANITEIKKLSICSKLVTGTYILQSNKAEYSNYATNPMCRLCNKADETIEHFILLCETTSQIRTTLIGKILHEGSLVLARESLQTPIDLITFIINTYYITSQRRCARMLKTESVITWVKWFDSDCNQKSALAATVSAKSNFEPDLFLGPPCSSAMRGVAQLASYWRRPVFGWVSNDIEFRNRTIYSTLIRLLGPLNKLPNVMRYVSKMFKWKRFSMIHDEAAPYVAVAAAIAENKDTTIKSTHEVSGRMDDTHIESIFQQVRKYSRILIFAVPKHTLRRYMIVAHRLGMSSGDFAFLCIHGDLYTWKQLNDEVLTDDVWRKNDKDDQGARQAFESVLHIIMPTLSEKLSEQFNHLVNKMKDVESNNWINLPPVSASDAYAPYLYDATLTWAIMVDKIMKENKDPSDGDIMFKRAVNFYQEGLTNFIVLDAEGDRLLNFWMLDMQENGRFQRIIEIKYGKIDVVANTTQSGDKLVRWANGKYGLHNAPPDVPACGFENEHCREDFTNTIVGAVCGSSFVLVVAIIINIVFRRYRRVQLLRSMIWQVKFEDIDFVTALLHGSVRNSFKNLSRRRTSSNKKKASRTSSGSGGGVISSNSSPPQFHKPDGGAMFGSVAYVRGSLVSVKRVNKGNITMTKDVLHQLNQLMELKQQNVCAFVGASFDPGRILLLWEYCPKGSIQDVIWNQNIKLDQMFKFALSLDIVKGLDFVHKSSVQYHGNLKSTNCVVDSRWTCKLTDFGVPSIRYVDRNIQEEPHDKLLWTAPEVLRNEKVLDKQKADLFSLGIILKEVFTRSGPYTEFPFLQPSDIIEKVREVPEGPVFRPLITVDFRKQNPDLFGVIDELWNDDPLHRPSASRAYKVLHRINPSKNLTMIDNMIAILEKYANHLEDLVAERTSELDAEKKKTENLLYRMLPRSVAEDLKAGKQVKAEQFDEATIYFSDIVGFTTICASSTPIEVETIGDAYMLASGLPKRNGSRHIREIADCALNILESITTFYIPHQQNQTVRIRIGQYIFMSLYQNLTVTIRIGESFFMSLPESNSYTAYR